MQNDKSSNSFQQIAADDISIVREFWQFLKTNKKWWMTPILAALLLVGLLVVLSGTAAAPFIYTLF